MPYSVSLALPASLIHSVVHAGDRTVSTRPSTCRACSVSSTSCRIRSIAGQPEYVGVIVTTTSSPSCRTPRSTPRSAIVSTGTSGSVTSPTASRIAVSVTMSPPDASEPHAAAPRADTRGARCDAPDGHHCAGTTPLAGCTWIRRSLPSLDASTRPAASTGPLRPRDVVPGRRTRTSRRCKARPLPEPACMRPMALVGAVAEAQHPLGRVVDVVRDLFDCLAGNAGQRLVGGRLAARRTSRC